jgi:hypothetical protein
MSLIVQISAVFGTALAVLSFALWRAARKSRYQAHSNEPFETTRTDAGIGQQRSNVSIDETVRQPESSLLVSPESRGSGTEPHRTSGKDQYPDSRSSSYQVVGDAPTPRITILDTGHAASAPITDAGKVSVIPASEIAEDSVTTQTSSSDCIPSSLFIESLLENETPEIIVEASPEPLGLSSSPRGLNGVDLQNQPGLILSEEVVSNTTEDLQISAKTSGRDTSELGALGENQGKPIESKEEGKIAEIVGNDRRTLPKSITAGMTEGQAIEGGAGPGQWTLASPVESEAIECVDRSEVSDRFVHDRARDAECGDKRHTYATDKVSTRMENRKSVVPPSQKGLMGQVNVEGDARSTRRCQPRPNPVAPSHQGSETQNDLPGSSRPNPPNEDRRSSRSRRSPQKV